MQRENFQFQFNFNVMKCTNKRFAVKNSDLSCLALIFNLSSPRMAILCAKKGLRLQIMNVIYCSFLIF